jgi:hypothetical protein
MCSLAFCSRVTVRQFYSLVRLKVVAVAAEAFGSIAKKSKHHGKSFSGSSTGCTSIRRSSLPVCDGSSLSTIHNTRCVERMRLLSKRFAGNIVPASGQLTLSARDKIYAMLPVRNVASGMLQLQKFRPSSGAAPSSQPGGISCYFQRGEWRSEIQFT